MFVTDVVGSDLRFRAILDDIDVVAPADCTVLIQGETGTGKEVIARAIHSASPRKAKAFIGLNCAAIPGSLLENELFGHSRGAFTGAVTQTDGRFQAAYNGTLFLDEIGDLPVELQPKLLRVLQEQQYERLGSTVSVKTNVRIIAATNQDLEGMVEERKFNAALYYRLAVFPISLPPLRERTSDIPLLAQHFTVKFANSLGKRITEIPEEVTDALQAYHWPGNIRELQNFIERAVIVSKSHVLCPRTQELDRLTRISNQRALSLVDIERAHIVETLHSCDWMVGGPRGAASRLGIPRTTLISKMNKLGIVRRIHAIPAAS